MPQPSESSAARTRRPVGSKSFTEPFRHQLESVEQGSGEIIKLLREQLDRRPYATLGAGVATGFVLGGGLTLRLTSGLIAIAGRVAMANFVSAALRGTQTTMERTES
jgi:hypothetical protein